MGIGKTVLDENGTSRRAAQASSSFTTPTLFFYAPAMLCISTRRGIAWPLISGSLLVTSTIGCASKDIIKLDLRA